MEKWFVDNYRPEFRWWGLVLHARRLAMAFVLAFVPDYSFFLSFLLFLVLQGAALAHHMASPFVCAIDNRAGLISLYLLVASYLAGLAFDGPSNPS